MSGYRPTTENTYANHEVNRATAEDNTSSNIESVTQSNAQEISPGDVSKEDNISEQEEGIEVPSDNPPLSDANSGCNADTTCTAHGDCFEGKCICFNPWDGDDCKIDKCRQYSESCNTCQLATTQEEKSLRCLWDPLQVTCFGVGLNHSTGQPIPFTCSPPTNYSLIILVVISLFGSYALYRFVKRRRRQSGGNALGQKSYRPVSQLEKKDDTWEDWGSDASGEMEVGGRSGGKMELRSLSNLDSAPPKRPLSTKSQGANIVRTESGAGNSDCDLFAELGIEARPVFQPTKKPMQTTSRVSSILSAYNAESVSDRVNHWDDGLEDIDP